MRLVVKEVLVGDDTIVIRHCIPVPSGTAGREQSSGAGSAPITSRTTEVTFCVRGVMTPPCGVPCAFASLALLHHARREPLPHQRQHPPIRNA